MFQMMMTTSRPRERTWTQNQDQEQGHDL